MWNGNSFRPIGFGRLSQENLRWGGTVDASTGLIAGVTEAGTTGGLKIGDAVPPASDQLGGLYLVVSLQVAASVKRRALLMTQVTGACASMPLKVGFVSTRLAAVAAVVRQALAICSTSR